MIDTATSGASTVTRSWQRRWTPALAGVGIVVLAVTACGGAASTTTPSDPSAAATSSPTPAPTASAAAFPGVVGTAAAVSGSSLEVQNPTSGQVTVTFTASTPISDTVTVTSKDVTAGSCVSVVGTPSAAGSATHSVTATTVTISAPVKGKCTGAGGFGGGFGGGGFGGGGFGGGTASPRPSFSARPRPTGSRGAFGNGAFGGANGKVLSVSASGFVVQARTRAAGASSSASATTTSVTVTTTATTKYLKTVTAKSSALKVGQCVTAIGTANSIGAIAARSIRISQPGPSGCVTGFGGRGGFGRPSANA